MNAVSRALRSLPSAAPIRPAFVATQRTYATAAATSAKAHPARRTYLHNKYTTLLNDN
ncbi:unnamed protein product [Umbelopsis vinacea]